MKTAILGFGTVGSGVYKVLTENRDIIAARLGEPAEVAYVLDLRDFPGQPVERVLTKNYEDILQDETVSVVVECMGGRHPAYEFVKQALENGKSAATSNKEMVSVYGAELLKIAREHHCEFLYEASVGGGIPVIRTLEKGLIADEIMSIEGILNGTTNYILTEMEEKGLPYETALAQAQQLGYAERNPEADVEGWDSCRKIAIMASMVCGQTVRPEDIATAGITKVTAADIHEAAASHQKIRLIARASFENGKVRASVSPLALPEDHPLSHVRGVYNGILIRGNMVSDITLEGRGAGSEATASAVVSDVINAMMHQKQGFYSGYGWEEDFAAVIPFED